MDKLSKLSLSNATSISTGTGVTWEQLLQLPEKVIQFGTGVLLRGLPDFFIDQANKQGVFNGRVVVVKSTHTGSADAFEEQDGLYVHWLRGIQDGAMVDKQLVNASISRVVNANTNWSDILDCATNPNFNIIVSNTTEVGITLTEDDVFANPPASFPGKLVAFLHKRFEHFNGDASAGMVIIPTELITDNGKLLQSICVELSKVNKLSNAFIQWLEKANDFCDSLVDRIVPGKPTAKENLQLAEILGVTDQLSIISEPYALWAIESSNPKVAEVLSFATVNPCVVITPDINKFRELKLRLLNGSHTISCGLAMLCGFQTVKEALQNEIFAQFLSNMLHNEIVPSITTNEINEATAVSFSNDVLDRFKNPFIAHKWLSITLNYSSKMKLRNQFTMSNYFDRMHGIPQSMALGFAAMILFLKPTRKEGDKYYGTILNNEYLIQDDNAKLFETQWQKTSTLEMVNNILENNVLWGVNAAQYPAFAHAVEGYINRLQQEDPIEVVASILKVIDK